VNNLLRCFVGIAVALSSFAAHAATIALQDFDGGTPTWGYATDVPFFINYNGAFIDGLYSDMTTTTHLPAIDFANISGEFLGVQDLNDEGDNGTSGFATVTFDDVITTGQTNLNISFDYDYVGLNTDNELNYEAIFDGVGQIPVRINSTTMTDSDEGTINIAVPDGTNTVALKIGIMQNSNGDSIAFDNFKVEGDVASGGGGGGATPMLVISEIMADPTSRSDPAWEWVEITNVGSETVALGGFVLDDQANPVLSSANILGGSIDPGASAVLFNGDDLTEQRFKDAWGDAVNAIPVTNWSGLNNSGDRIGLWQSLADYNGRDFSGALAEAGYGPVSPGVSIELADLTNPGAFSDSSVGVNGAYASTKTFESTTGGSGDVANPGVVPGGAISGGPLVFTEIMYDPTVTSAAWEWVEVVNTSGAAINFADTPWVLDDDNSFTLSGANITSGIINPGQVAILYNADDLSAADFLASWGDQNLIPVTGWFNISLSNLGEKISLWDSFANYFGDERDHLQTAFTVTYPDLAARGQSIFLTDLSDPTNPGSWIAADPNDGISFSDGRVLDNNGGEVGSPGYANPIASDDPSTSTSAAVPEPLSGLLSAFAAGALLLRRRR